MKLTEYRKNADEYHKKCGNLVARIKSVFKEINPSDLSTEQKALVSKLNEIIAKEKLYAQSASELRQPTNWKSD